MADELSVAMDGWQLDMASCLQTEYGHSFSSAWLLSKYSRDMLEAELRKPQSLIIVTGCA